ncbi:hypothetical protein NO995_00880 [Aestuariibaculum sp. M13]|uniref:hypothetical protein n=1 Tax=Aestuariibaculum sp. M13 TaxID=2967132 RepID=UPI00215A06DD|nr:hypothetical protein [Aestuariibaculum sp. M13]MCR8666225.1 hypothetical protein [Aestuariibaculum sp. M13]
MIKRSGLKGIDRELAFLIISSLEDIQGRMIYHNHNHVFHELLETLGGNSGNKTYTLEFQRHDDKMQLSVDKNCLEINYEGIEGDTLVETTYPIYSYNYKNNNDNYPEIHEEGDFFIFSEKWHEHLKGIDIDEVILK